MTCTSRAWISFKKWQQWWAAVVSLNLGRLAVQEGDTARGLSLIKDSL